MATHDQNMEHEKNKSTQDPNRTQSSGGSSTSQRSNEQTSKSSGSQGSQSGSQSGSSGSTRPPGSSEKR